MDTCLLTSAVPISECAAALDRMRACLQQHRFSEGRYFSPDELEAYRGRLADVERRWAAFARAGWSDAIAAERRRPYQWQRAGGDVELAGRRHIVHVFLCPAAEGEAALSILFDASVWRALRSDDGAIDEAVRADLLALIHGVVDSFAPAAFGVLRVDDPTDLARLLTAADVRDWLLVPSLDIVRAWPLALAGLRDAPALGDVRARRSSGHLFERGGYLELDLIS